jgi:hypothetical protein
MADNFNLRSFLSENKLTKNTQLLKEGSDYGYEALMDVVDNEYDGDPAIAAAVEDAFNNGDIDTSEFGHDPSAPSNAVAQIANGMDIEAAQQSMGFEEGIDEEAPASMQAGFDMVSQEKRKHAEMMRVANKLFPEFGGKLENFKPLSSQQREMVYQNLDPANLKETVKENKMTQRDKYLTRLVENALGVTNNDEDDDFDPGHDIEQAQHNIERQYEGEDYGTNAVTGKPLPKPDPIVEDEMVNEKPLPKYENIEKLMQEIDKSTDEAAHKYKMEEMKRVADGLEKKATALEEGDDSDHIDQKKLKQMKKDIMSLRKGIEKMEKLGEKKFTKKETKDSKSAESLAEGNFDLRKFLVENKLTRDSQIIN